MTIDLHFRGSTMKLHFLKHNNWLNRNIFTCLFKEAKAPDSLDDKEHGKNYGSSWVEFPENAALSVKVKVAPGPEGSELIDNQED